MGHHFVSPAEWVRNGYPGPATLIGEFVATESLQAPHACVSVCENRTTSGVSNGLRPVAPVNIAPDNVARDEATGPLPVCYPVPSGSA